MHVVAEAAWDWFLFEDDEMLYLDVLVEHGAISFTVTAPLSPAQASDYRREGVACLAGWSADMRRLALAREWRIPALPAGWAARSFDAVRAWRQRGAA